MAQLEVNLVSTDRTLWIGAATMVVAPTTDGEIGVMAGHVPVLSVLKPGTVRIHTVEGSDVTAQIDGGFISLDRDLVTIAVDSATIVDAAATR